MKKIVVNKCYGGFSLSHSAIMFYAELSGFKLYPIVSVNRNNLSGNGKYRLANEDELDKLFGPHYIKNPLKDGKYNNKDYFYDRNIPRDDVNLVKVVEQLGEKANGSCAKLRIVEIPDNVKWHIAEYDGLEHVAEDHKTW